MSPRPPEGPSARPTPMEVNLRRPGPRLRRAMRLAGWTGVLVSVGALGALGYTALQSPAPLAEAALGEYRTQARWLIGGLMVAALGFFDR